MVYADQGEGDNIEFTAVTAGDYEIYLQSNEEGTDEEFTKYSHKSNGDGYGLTARKFVIRADNNVDLTELNGEEFTNLCQITGNKSHIEERNFPSVHKLKIRTFAANTTIKVRWF